MAKKNYELTLFDDRQDLCIQSKGQTIARVRRESTGYAKMFLAAPDMYEALKSALALLDKQREEYNSAVTILPHKPVGEGEIAKAAREALAKAEGK